MTHHKGWPGAQHLAWRSPGRLWEQQPWRTVSFQGEQLFSPNLYYVGVGEASHTGWAQSEEAPLRGLYDLGGKEQDRKTY